MYFQVLLLSAAVLSADGEGPCDHRADSEIEGQRGQQLMKPERKHPNWNSKSPAIAAGVGQIMRSERAGAADRITPELCVQVIWLGTEGSIPIDCSGKLTDQGGEQQAWDTTARRAKCVGCLMGTFLATTALTSMFPRAGSASLAKRGRGWKIVGFMPTWVPAGRILHMLLSAQWHSGLPFTFLITLKSSHMDLLPVWTGAQWQLV